MNWIDEGALYSQIGLFLREDLGRGDITTQSIIARNTRARARFVAGEKMIVAGLEAAEEVFLTLDSQYLSAVHPATPSALVDAARPLVATAAELVRRYPSDPEAVALDVRNERVSLAAAAEVYGVRIDAATLAVDEDATRALREPKRGAVDTKASPAHFRAWPLSEEEFERLAGGQPLAEAAA